MALEVRIKKRLHEFLLDVDFTADGGVTALLGASGSGKSMTLKCIAGIERPDEGYIALDGRVLFDASRGVNLPPQQRRVGYLFQNYALFPTMTVAGNIAAGVRRGKQERRRIVEEKLETFLLTGVADKLPQQLSGGQQQRVALARILASEPETILLDEPFSALDSHLKWQLEQELMERLAAFPGAKLFVSHDRDEVYRNCTHVCVIDAGRSEPIVTTRELFSHPRTMRAALLSGCKNNVPMQALPDGRVFLPDWGLTLASAERAGAGHRYAGLRAHHLHPGAPGGENAFPCHICRVTENVFSVILILSVDGAKASAPQLRMELDRAAYAALPAQEGMTVQIAPEDVLLLQ